MLTIPCALLIKQIVNRTINNIYIEWFDKIFIAMTIPNYITLLTVL